MGILDSLILITGIGLIGYVTYVSIGPTVFQRLIGYTTSPGAVAAAAPYVPPPTTTTTTPAPIPPDIDDEPAAAKPPPSSPIAKLVPGTSNATAPNVAGTAFTFNVVGDLDDNALALATATNLCGTAPTLVMIIGDFAYHNDAQKWWTGSMKPCNGKNVVGSVGNHDNSGKGFLELFPANGGKWEFTKKVGNIAFIAVNTGYCSSTCMDLKSEALFQQAQADPSVKFIVVHFHKPIFTTGTAPDAPMSLHNMMKKYSKVKMAFAGHNHSYRRYTIQDGIQYITAGAGGHDKTKSTAVTKGPSSGSVGVVKCRVATDGAMTCQYVANNGVILDQWGLTAAGKHTGTGGVAPEQGSAPSESGYVAAAYFGSLVDSYYSNYDFQDKEERDNAILKLMDEHDIRIHPRRKLNNTIYHYSAPRRRHR